MDDLEVVKDYCRAMLDENNKKKNHHGDYNKALEQVLRFVETIKAFKKDTPRGETSNE